ncbi:hypothetical protein SOVF_123900 isoform B [Spinacia oleracea]|uniref:Elongation factor Ts, mitochondrial n=1 Tax=Spinacia oleracea TaxID=3562 RepID=A0A9R0K0B5_SPIOL|nr:elongation factor Ts, mitochondrial isoform X2 [Spinacia oleracea]KNA12669.1 hypothetical protein SOVF_123900 isoform B [Spinacia oleracea]
MALSGGAKRSIGIICSKVRSGHHRVLTMSVKGSCSQSIIDDVQSGSGFPGVFLRRYSAASSSDQMGLIKKLRERTSAPIKDVKSALVDCNWDIEAAQKELRRRGVYQASKKSSRKATEGLLALAQNDTKTAIIELNCETDFVARNDIFQYMALSLAKLALSAEGSSQQVAGAFPMTPEYLESLKLNLAHPKISGEMSAQEAVTELAAMMGENVKLRRSFAMSKTSPGIISTYLHSSPQSGLGRLGGVLSLQVEDPNADMAAIQRVGSELAMHVVANKPLFLSKDLVSSDALDNEREILRSQAEASGKPKIAIEKMVEGRLRKYFEEVVLMEQKYVMNDTVNVKTVLDNLSKEVGSPVRIESFLRLEVGEGIESSETSESESVA